MTSALEHWPAPPLRGWRADDLDHLPTEGPNGERLRFELIDGALSYMPPQRRFHERTIYGLRTGINAQSPVEWQAVAEMGVRIDRDTQVYPDVLVITAEAAEDEDRSWYTPGEVLLAIEVVSPDSVKRDRKTKPPLYAEAGIQHFWRIERSEGKRVAYIFELERTTKSYIPTGIFHGTLSTPMPFPIEIDLDNLPL